MADDFISKLWLQSRITLLNIIEQSLNQVTSFTVVLGEPCQTGYCWVDNSCPLHDAFVSSMLNSPFKGIKSNNKHSSFQIHPVFSKSRVLSRCLQTNFTLKSRHLTCFVGYFPIRKILMNSLNINLYLIKQAFRKYITRRIVNLD